MSEEVVLQVETSFYKCGHGSEPLFFKNTDVLAFVDYRVWKDRYGFNGDRSMCFRCFLKAKKKRLRVRSVGGGKK